MLFRIPTGREQYVGGELKATAVEFLQLDTGSAVARTNRRKLRRYLTQVEGIKPQWVKYVMKELGFWDKDVLGIPPEERAKLKVQDA